MKKAEVTRSHMLRKAYELIYLKGYQTTSIDDILATTQVTKGAFYYHFKNKDEMGVAIVQEILKPRFLSQITETFHREKDALKAIYKMIRNLLLDNEMLKFERGCPLSNFIQEMTPHNGVFTVVLSKVTLEWKQIITTNLEIAKQASTVKIDTQANSVAMFVISSYWGIRNFGRTDDAVKVYRSYLKELKRYLDSLR